jgi:hypothetical protein
LFIPHLLVVQFSKRQGKGEFTGMEIRPARDEDEAGIRDLFKVCFGTELSHEEWLWKYKRSFLGTSSFLAEDEGRIVAHYGAVKMPFYGGGTIFNGYQGCDVMTHPQYRARLFSKRGIIVRTAEAYYASEPMEFIFGFPSERHGRLMTLQLKWARHRHINVMKKERDHFAPRRDPFLRVETGWGTIDPEEIEGIWKKQRDSLMLSVEKGSRYILWRYRDNPRKKYEIAAFRGLLTRTLKAYAILKREDDALHILDFFIPGTLDPRRVFGALEGLAVKWSAGVIALWVNPREGVFQQLNDAGYRREEGIPYAVRIFEGSRADADFFLDSYCYREGDYDAA